jgi:hypothetical protein
MLIVRSYTTIFLPTFKVQARSSERIGASSDAEDGIPCGLAYGWVERKRLPIAIKGTSPSCQGVSENIKQNHSCVIQHHPR